MRDGWKDVCETVRWTGLRWQPRSFPKRWVCMHTLCASDRRCYTSILARARGLPLRVVGTRNGIFGHSGIVLFLPMMVSGFTMGMDIDGSRTPVIRYSTSLASILLSVMCLHSCASRSEFVQVNRCFRCPGFWTKVRRFWLFITCRNCWTIGHKGKHKGL